MWQYIFVCIWKRCLKIINTNTLRGKNTVSDVLRPLWVLPRAYPMDPDTYFSMEFYFIPVLSRIISSQRLPNPSGGVIQNMTSVTNNLAFTIIIFARPKMSRDGRSMLVGDGNNWGMLATSFALFFNRRQADDGAVWDSTVAFDVNDSRRVTATTGVLKTSFKVHLLLLYFVAISLSLP